MREEEWHHGVIMILAIFSWRAAHGTCCVIVLLQRESVPCLPMQLMRHIASEHQVGDFAFAAVLDGGWKVPRCVYSTNVACLNAVLCALPEYFHL